MNFCLTTGSGDRECFGFSFSKVVAWFQLSVVIRQVTQWERFGAMSNICLNTLELTHIFTVHTVICSPTALSGTSSILPEHFVIIQLLAFP